MKTESASTMTRLRSKREKSIGVTGPQSATTTAKTVTVQPASETDTPKVSAMIGIIPTTPISVLRMPKTPSVRIGTRKR